MSLRNNIDREAERDSLRVELGSWFKAYATGRGVIAIPLLVGLVLAAGLAKTFFG